MRRRQLQGAALWTSTLAWFVPAMLYAGDACAWGLYTHVYFGQLLLWAVPLLDARFRRAVRRFPELCLAGTCLPDVSLFSGVMRAPMLRTTHRWTSASSMLHGATTDEMRAVAIGYTVHLVTDIVAHNYFVPAHERLWLRGRMLTHASAEWAMDTHVSAHVSVRPQDLLSRHRDLLGGCAQHRLGFARPEAAHALGCLRIGEKLLRASRLPQLVYAAARRADPLVRVRFDDYVRQTSERLRQINRVIAGETPAWLPEIDSGGDHRAYEEELPSPYRLLLPRDWFNDEPTH